MQSSILPGRQEQLTQKPDKAVKFPLQSYPNKVNVVNQNRHKGYKDTRRPMVYVYNTV